MLIGELSKRSGFSRDTIRYYQKLGLIPTDVNNKHTGNSYNDYPLEMLARLHHIHHLKECGFTLLEIRRLLTNDKDSNACDNLPAKLVDKLLKIDQRIAILLEHRKSLLQIQTLCSGSCSTDQGIPECVPPLTARKNG